MAENLYDTLGVSENATGDEIKKAYRALSMKWHPDKNKDSPDAVSQFQKISSAYETLSDESKRAQYNMSRRNPFAQMGGGMGGGMGGFEIPVDDIFSMLFGGGHPMGGVHMSPMGGRPMGGRPMGGHPMGGHPMGGHPMGGHPMGGHPMGGMFPGVNIFHGADHLNLQSRLNKPPPIIKNVSVTIEQIIGDYTLPVEIERWILENGNKMFEKETIYVEIPKGIDDNEIIILRDKGNVKDENCKGDVKLFIQVVNTTAFKRSGLDLIMEKSISLKDALCGFSFDIKYINGKSYTINNSSGNIIPANYNKTIPNMGLERNNHKGNLIIVFNVEFPDKLTSEQIAGLTKLL
jgi:DnaJ-class molecular chaperone